jgi:hypothetical protein
MDRPAGFMKSIMQIAAIHRTNTIGGMKLAV